MIRTVITIGCALLAMAGCKPKANQKASAPSENNVSTKIEPTELTAEDFKKQVADYEANPDKWVFEGKRPAVIDFYATWCGPSKMTAPIIAELANTYAGKVDFYKIDIDKQPELAALFGINSIPTLLFIPMEGNPIISVGAMDKQQMQTAIQKNLAQQ